MSYVSSLSLPCTPLPFFPSCNGTRCLLLAPTHTCCFSHVAFGTLVSFHLFQNICPRFSVQRASYPAPLISTLRCLGLGLGLLAVYPPPPPPLYAFQIVIQYELYWVCLCFKGICSMLYPTCHIYGARRTPKYLSPLEYIFFLPPHVFLAYSNVQK